MEDPKDTDLSTEVVVEQFDGVDLSVELFRLINLLLFDDLPPGLDDVLHLALRLAHRLVEFLYSPRVTIYTHIARQTSDRKPHIFYPV